MLSLFKKKKKEKLPARQLGNSCLNCAVKLNGDENFCPECGQRNNINKLSFKLVLDEFIGDMFTYDSRVWRTLVPLILKPGKVAYDFISGKRKKFVNPFRTYLTISLIFFLLLGLISTIDELKSDGTESFKSSFINFGDNNNNTEKDSLSVRKKDSIAKAKLAEVQKNISVDLDSTLRANNVNIDSLSKYGTSMDTIKKKASEQSPFVKKVTAFYTYYEENKEHSVAQALDSLGYENTFWNRFYFDKAKDTKDMFDDKGENFQKKMVSGMSITIFLLLPVFAWFLKIFYFRRKYTYMEHMVFVYYSQSVLFFLLLLFSLIYVFFNNSDGFYHIPIILFSIYLLLAMKAFYKQNWFKTIVKYALANFSFMFVAWLGMVILTFVSFIFL